MKELHNIKANVDYLLTFLLPRSSRKTNKNPGNKSYVALGFQRSEGTRSRHRRGRSQEFGDMSPTSVFAGLPGTANLRK